MNTDREEFIAFQEGVMSVRVIGIGKVENYRLCGKLEGKSVEEKSLDGCVAVLQNPWYNYLLIVLMLVTRQN